MTRVCDTGHPFQDEQVRVVTHLWWLRRDRKCQVAALFLSTRWKTETGFNASPWTPGFPTKIGLPSNTKTFPVPAPRWLLSAFRGHSKQYCEVTLGVISVSLRRFAYDARSRSHSLVWLRRGGDSSFIPFLTRRTLSLGLVPRSETPRFPSKIRLPSSTNTIPIPVPR